MASWSENLRLQVPLLDSQHVEIFSVCDRIVQAAAASTPAAIENEVRFLTGYIDFHFAMEERLMTATHYAELEVHRAEHVAFRDKVTPLLEQAEKDPKAVSALADTVTRWLNEHILHTDQKLATFISQSIKAKK